MALPEEYK
jgi:hypothetical protein